VPVDGGAPRPHLLAGPLGAREYGHVTLGGGDGRQPAGDGPGSRDCQALRHGWSFLSIDSPVNAYLSPADDTVWRFVTRSKERRGIGGRRGVTEPYRYSGNGLALREGAGAAPRSGCASEEPSCCVAG